MNRINGWTAAGSFVAVLAGVFAGTAGAALYEIDHDGVRVRKGPSSDTGVVKTLDKRTPVNVIARQGDWRQINMPVKGWVYREALHLGLKRYVRVKEGHKLGVHAAPRSSSDILKRLAHRTEVRVMKMEGHWRWIDQPTRGWVYRDYLAKEIPEPYAPSVGSPNSAGFVRLPSSATGIFWYCSVSDHHWGVPRLISKTLTMGRQWAPRRIGCGDMSLPHGGYFPPHSTHQDGHAEDFEPMTTSGSGGATVVGYSSYSTYYNQRFVNLMYSTPVSVAFVLHNNSRISRVQYSSGHDNHLHMAVY